MFWVTVREQVKWRGQYTPPPIYFDPTEKSYYIWTVSQPTQPGISFVSASWSNQQQNNVRGGRRFSSFQTRLDIQSIQLPIFSQTFLGAPLTSKVEELNGKVQFSFRFLASFHAGICWQIVLNSLLYAEPCM